MHDHLTPAERLARYQRQCRIKEYSFIVGFGLFLFACLFWSI